MPLPHHLLTEKIIVRRRRSTGRDALNNPQYGEPTSGDGWYTVYQAVPVRLAFSGKDITFAPEGERVVPSGLVYYEPQYQLREEDRILTERGIEYTVIGITVAYLLGSVVDHYEAVVQLP